MQSFIVIASTQSNISQYNILRSTQYQQPLTAAAAMAIAYTYWI